MKNLFFNYFQKRKKEDFLKKTDFWSSVFLFDPIAVPLMKIIAKTKITPNQISVSTIFSSVLVAIFFLFSQRYMQIFGAVIFYLTFVLDSVDGKLARLRGTQSEFGAKLDAICDHFSKLIILLALAYSQFYVWGGIQTFIFGLSLIFIHYLFHLFHRILLKRNTYKGYSGYRELLIFKKELGEKFIKKGLFPSLYSYSEEKHFFLIIAPMFGIFREFLVVSLFLSLIFKVFPEIIFLFSKKKLEKLQFVKSKI